MKFFYETYAEASQAAQKLNIKSANDYYSRYKEDPKLPCRMRHTCNQNYSTIRIQAQWFIAQFQLRLIVSHTKKFELSQSLLIECTYAT